MAETLKRMYEGMFLVDSSIAASNWEEMQATLNTLFSRAQAEVVSLRKWDDRRLCYDIKGHKRGLYILAYFKAMPNMIGQIERDVQISETILRVLILKGDHVTEASISAPTPAEVQSQSPSASEGYDGDRDRDREYPAARSKSRFSNDDDDINYEAEDSQASR